MPKAGTPRAESRPNARGEQSVLGGRQGHLGADHGPAVEGAEAGDDDAAATTR